jgi:hypothetical protein
VKKNRETILSKDNAILIVALKMNVLKFGVRFSSWQLKQEQELQHQLLLQRYQAQRQQLAEAHEKQLQQRLKVIVQVQIEILVFIFFPSKMGKNGSDCIRYS